MDIKMLTKFAEETYKIYLAEENIATPLPLNNIIFAEDMLQAVSQLQPQLLEQTGFNKEQLRKCGGHTLLFPNDTATIIIKKDNNMNNFLWMGTLVHELTHIKDYSEYKEMLNGKNFQELLKNISFWYWTEFHARYKGFLYVFKFAKNLPQDLYQKYIEDTKQRIIDFPKTINKEISYQIKAYYTMHIIGEILACEASSIHTLKTEIDNLCLLFDWFNDMKTFLSKHIESITVDKMFLLSRNIRLIFDNDNFFS